MLLLLSTSVNIFIFCIYYTLTKKELYDLTSYPSKTIASKMDSMVVIVTKPTLDGNYLLQVRNK